METESYKDVNPQFNAMPTKVESERRSPNPARAEARGARGGYRREAMRRTPWGDAEELRERRLPPGPATPRAEVERSQRERLFAAIVVLVAERGYQRTRVADVLELSGVSRKAFYEHFGDKASCFGAAVELPMGAGVAAAKRVLGEASDGDPRRRGEEALGALLRSFAAQPAAARACVIGAHGADGAGLAALERARKELTRLGARVLAEAQGIDRFPPELARAVAGGIEGVAHRCLREGREDELAGMAAPLWRWALRMTPPPRPLAARRSHPGAAEALPFAARVPAERVVRAFADAVSERGYAGTAISAIAATGSISLSTFYEHFDSKEEVLDAALDASAAQLLAAALPPARPAQGSIEAVRPAVQGACDFLAAEPAFARLRAREAYAAGAEAVERRDRGDAEIFAALAAFAGVRARELDPLPVEATLGAIHALLEEWVENKAPERLGELAPLITYLALVPFSGTEAAARAAGSPAPRGRRRDPGRGGQR